MGEPIRFRGVGKRYGSVTALEDVDLTMREGEITCVVGPNGSGKTTLFALAVGLVGPTSGTVERPATGDGGSFQRPSVYPDLAVVENLDAYWGVTASTDEAWRQTLVDRLDLDQVRHRIAGDLSRGWQRRLDLALAFLKRPTFALLDEPLSGLDDPTKRTLRSFLASYADGERAVVVATHSVAAFDPIVDHLTVFDRGRVCYDGPVDEVTTASERYRAAFE
jgi:ABC-2 type transport system ATP-binding protein